MKTVLSLVLVFLFAGIASAQPWRDGQGPPREKKFSPKDFGDVERLERPGRPDRPGPQHQREEFRPQKQFRPQPNFGMNGWGGDPFKSFTGHSPWGRVDAQRGPGGPPHPFRGDSVSNRGPGRQHDNFGKDFKVPNGKGKPGRNHKDGKACPFCGK